MSDLTAKDKIYEVRRTIALLSTMINSGEKHSDRSIEFTNKAIAYLDELNKANEDNKEQDKALNKHIVSFSEERAEVCDVCNNSIYTSEFGTQVRTHKCHKCGK